MTPREVWAPRRIQGRPGYSARGLNSVSPPDDTPLSVAGRIVDQRIHDAVRAECERRHAAGEPREAIEGFRSEIMGLNGLRFVAWEWLCGSFEAVLFVLEAEWREHPRKAWLAPLIRQARRAGRVSS